MCTTKNMCKTRSRKQRDPRLGIKKRASEWRGREVLKLGPNKEWSAQPGAARLSSRQDDSNEQVKQKEFPRCLNMLIGDLTILSESLLLSTILGAWKQFWIQLFTYMNFASLEEEKGKK